MKDESDNNKGLFLKVLVRYIIVIIVLGILFFVTAGTFNYINGWIYLITIVLTLGTGFIILYRKDKSLLQKRIKTTEKDPKQRLFILISTTLILAIYGLPGLDFRFKWTYIPLEITFVGEIILVIGYVLNIKVMLTNSYASRVVEIQEKQKLIDTGLYSVVRHPMYMAMVPIYFGTCLILGSAVALIPCILMFFSLGYRVINEEKVLTDGLEGYKEYKKRVKYRIIPYIW